MSVNAEGQNGGIAPSHDKSLLNALLNVVESMDSDESIDPVEAAEESAPELTDAILERSRERVYERLGLDANGRRDESAFNNQGRLKGRYPIRFAGRTGVIHDGHVAEIGRRSAAPVIPLVKYLSQSEMRLRSPGRWFAAEPTRSMPRVSVVMPTFSGGSRLPKLLHSMPRDVHELVIVGDSFVEVQDAPSWLSSQMVFKPAEAGKSLLTSGFQSATGDVIVVMSDDGSMDPGQIPLLIEALINGADFVKAARSSAGAGSLHRKAGLMDKWVTKLGNHLWGTRFEDLSYGYVAFWDHCIPDLAPIDECTLTTGAATSYDQLRAGVFLNIQAAWRSFEVQEVKLGEPSSAGEHLPGGRKDLARLLLMLIKSRGHRDIRADCGFEKEWFPFEAEEGESDRKDATAAWVSPCKWIG